MPAPSQYRAVLLSLLACAGAALASSALAQPLTAGSADCGGDAFSSGEVVENRPPRRGPVIALPQTMCADLAPQQPPANVQIGVFPTIRPGRGVGGDRAPY